MNKRSMIKKKNSKVLRSLINKVFTGLSLSVMERRQKTRLSLILVFVYFIVIVFSGCKKEDQTRLQASWSAKDPILIPHNIRNNEKNFGNLIQNPSFETGKIYYEESNIKSYDITGWKRVGDNIKWVDSNNGEYKKDEVYEGTHSVKIERNNADETELIGEGIISDFIKVIPGNYSFKLFLRLENICPNQSRIGTKMYDAVNLRLLFYDKNKLEINGIEYDAFRNKKIDNTFKSLTLSNYWQIDKLNWGEIHAKTANYPFFDGDIPDEARYVKIFVGLKGTGKMWIDNVDFRYTDENFTMLERMKPYFDSSFFVSDMVYPQPKQIIKKSQIEFFNKDLVLYPIIVIPDNASKLVNESALELKKMLISKIKNENIKLYADIEIVKNIDMNEISEKQFIVSIGNNDFYNNFKTELPDTSIKNYKSAYYIIQLEDRENIVFINALGDEAIKYALNSFNQLFDSKSLIYYSANIIDYPDILERAFLLHSFDGNLNDLNTKLNLLNQYKFNKPYFEWYGADNKNYFPYNSFDELTFENNFMNFSAMLDLVKLNAKQSLIKCKAFHKHDFEALISKSPKSLLLAGDYYQTYEDCNPEKVVFYSNKKLTKNLQFDHIKLLNDLSDYINDSNLSIKIEFLPPWNRLDLIDKGQGQAEFYYYDLNKSISENISIYWTGGTYCSESIDNAEYYRINELIGTSPVLYDNSLLNTELRFNNDLVKNYYAGKIRTLSIFEPYKLNTFEGFNENLRESKILLNTGELSELLTIRILTAANYLWNTKTYNSDKSLWIVLNKMFGRGNAIKLLYFNDSYYGLKEICQKIEANGLQFKNVRIAKNFELDLIKHYEDLEVSMDNKDLLAELKMLKTDVLGKYNTLVKTVK